jgi:hypothetical protein
MILLLVEKGVFCRSVHHSARRRVKDRPNPSLPHVFLLQALNIDQALGNVLLFKVEILSVTVASDLTLSYSPTLSVPDQKDSLTLIMPFPIAVSISRAILVLEFIDFRYPS